MSDLTTYTQEQLTCIQSDIENLSKKTLWGLMARSGQHRNEVFTETIRFSEAPFTTKSGLFRYEWVPTEFLRMARKYGDSQCCFRSSMMVKNHLNKNIYETHVFVFTANFYFRYKSYITLTATHYEMLEWHEVPIPRNLLVFYKMFTPMDKHHEGIDLFRNSQFIRVFEQNPMAFTNVFENEDEERKRREQLEKLDAEKAELAERCSLVEKEMESLRREMRLLEAEKSNLELRFAEKDTQVEQQKDKIQELTAMLDSIHMDEEKKRQEAVKHITNLNIDLQRQIAELRQQLERYTMAPPTTRSSSRSRDVEPVTKRYREDHNRDYDIRDYDNDREYYNADRRDRRSSSRR